MISLIIIISGVITEWAGVPPELADLLSAPREILLVSFSLLRFMLNYFLAVYKMCSC